MDGLPTDLLATRSTSLAVELARAGADLVVVGSTARRLRGDTDLRPHDLDVVVLVDDIAGLCAALGDLGVEASAATLRRAGSARVHTGWCELDVFVAAQAPLSRRVHASGSSLTVARERVHE